MPALLVPFLAVGVGLLLYLLAAAVSSAFSTLAEKATGLPWWLGGIPYVAGFVSTPFGKLMHAIKSRIADGAIKAEGPSVGFVVHLAAVLEDTAITTFRLAQRIEAALLALRYKTLPALLRTVHTTAVALPTRTAKALHRFETQLEAEIASLRAQARAITAEAAASIATSQRALRNSLATPADVALPGIREKIGGLEKEASNTTKVLRGLAAALGLGVLAGNLAHVLPRIGVGNVRCNNSRDFQKRLCGMDPGLLESVLAGGLLIVGGIDLIALTKACQSVTLEVSTLADGFIRKDALIAKQKA